MEQKDTGSGSVQDINGNDNVTLIDFSAVMQPGLTPESVTGINFDEKSGHINLSVDTKAGDKASLIELSEIIDAFGIDSTHPEWESKYSKMDINRNGVIDIEDISSLAKNI